MLQCSLYDALAENSYGAITNINAVTNLILSIIIIIIKNQWHMGFAHTDLYFMAYSGRDWALCAEEAVIAA